jgi:ferrous iron transport protein B
MSHTLTIALCGNPNSGKTTTFNLLTGSRHQVGNWPGVTVEKKVGQLKLGKKFKSKDSDRLTRHTIDIVDLPGTYSLDALDESIALDEKIARNYILSDQADLIVNIIDASNIERNLYLTTQLLEIGKPMVVILNMMDVAKKNKTEIDIAKFSETLGCPVIPLIASQQKTPIELVESLLNVAEGKFEVVDFELDFHAPLGDFYSEMLPIARSISGNNLRPEWLAVRLLEDHSFAVTDEYRESVKAIQSKIIKEYDEDIDIIIAEARYEKILSWIDSCVKKEGRLSRTLSKKLDSVFLNKYLGVPLFLFVTYLMFMFTINFGGAFIDFFDLSTNAILVEGASIWLTGLGLPEWLVTLLANGVGGGVQVVSTFIPIIGSLYLFLAVLEDSGYLARGAFVMDRFMQAIGLPGKSFIPLMVGLGCTVPAIYATRSLEYEKDRIMTVMMSPFISCGARLPVYILFAAVFFPENAQNLIFSLYMIGIVIAVLTGLLLKKTLLAGETTPFVMELPAYHMPRLKSVLLKAWEKLRSFVLGAGKLIVLVVILLSFFNSLGTDLSFGNENTEKSVLTNVGKSLTPAFKPIGIKQENWPATVGLFTGLFAKEVIVGTIDALYLSQIKVETEVDSFSLSEKLAEAVQTIPDNFSEALGTWADPLGMNVDVSDTKSIAQDQEVSEDIFPLIKQSFDGTLGAFSYLLFILLYSPCVSALGATHKETGTGWTVFSILWTTFLAYSLATIAYQIGQISQSPVTAIGWIVFFVTLHVINIIGLKVWAKKKQAQLSEGNTDKYSSVSV